ncbi:GGDEF domain-containing protein [Neptunomonas antarctica]|uniref:diguanylate cyclase n=1 Tax=Neptunomonas antarctica TaxID=619304 RepID=A0A1N7LQ14_9GAMM|nr:sensor domain-containing diguanylate cyclase [Neptunomonas antarctica]SIS75859.1 diguanylate cyclase (GGDEF) domain-containing protein [Neptunomonas antarctica]
MTDSEGLQQRRFECLLTAIDQIVIHLNGAGEVISVNAGSADWLKTDQMISRTFSALFSEDLAGDVSAQIDKAFETHEPQKLTLLMKPEHSFHWHELGLRLTQTWETKLVDVSDTELIWVAKNISQPAQQEQKVVKLSQRDPLTGAYNQRSLMTILKQSVAQAQRYDWVCSVLLIDIDHFSQVNDQYGLDTGDKVLQQFVEAMHAFQRTADFFARYADDRFVMFLPETNREQALLAAERVRKLAQEQCVVGPSGELEFTVSIGTASLRDSQDTPDSLLKRAEENLFIAKQSGTNRIEGDEV